MSVLSSWFPEFESAEELDTKSRRSMSWSINWETDGWSAWGKDANRESLVTLFWVELEIIRSITAPAFTHRICTSVHPRLIMTPSLVGIICTGKDLSIWSLVIGNMVCIPMTPKRSNGVVWIRIFQEAEILMLTVLRSKQLQKGRGISPPPQPATRKAWQKKHSTFSLWQDLHYTSWVMKVCTKVWQSEFPIHITVDCRFPLLQRNSNSRKDSKLVHSGLASSFATLNRKRLARKQPRRNSCPPARKPMVRMKVFAWCTSQILKELIMKN